MSDIATAAHVDVDVDAIDTYYYAAAHRSVLRSITLRNVNLSASSDDLILHVTVESAAGIQPLQAVNVAIPHLEPGDRRVLNNIRLRPNHRALALLDEQLNADLVVTVRHAGVIVGEVRSSITFLAFNQWMYRPEYFDSLAAFVQPNSGTVRSVLSRAGTLLLERTGSDSTQGYQSGPNRAHEVAAAIYDALCELNLRYTDPPASFEGYGQKVRTPEIVQLERAATCLDSSVLYVSCLTAAGLAAHIVVVAGHAFAAYQLTEELTEEAHRLLQRSVVDNPNEVAALFGLGVLQPVETTTFTSDRDTVSFEEACTLRRDYFTTRSSEIRGLVNVAYARLHGVPPIPSQGLLAAEATPDELVSEPLIPVDVVARRAKDEPFGEIQRRAPDESAPPRVRAWLRSLLDLSYANPLLRLGGPRGTTGVHRFEMPDGLLSALEDRLMSVGSFDLRVATQAPAALLRDPADAAAQAQELTDSGRLYSPSLAEHEADLAHHLKKVAKDNPSAPRSEVNSFVGSVLEVAYSKALEKSLGGLRRKAREIETQTGANTLFLTIGTLAWAEQSPSARGKIDQGRAPLFLVPVRITGKARTGFKIEVGDAADVVPNYCLLEKLRRTYGIVLDDLERPVVDTSGIDVDRMIGSIRLSLGKANIRDAVVNEDAYLAVLNFATFRLWKDLRDHWQAFMESPVARHLIETPNESFEDEDRAIPFDAMQLRCPGELDASQQEAVEWALQGRSFVLEGPPGTGKSQTITNLLAANIAAGRKVLFVAEKQAALQVVKKRIADVGLATFCLDLHDKGSRPEQIREQIRASLDFVPVDRTAALAETTAAWFADGAALHGYREAMHSVGPAGHSAWTAHQERMAMVAEPVEVPRSFVEHAKDLLPNVQEALLNLPRVVGAAPLQRGLPWSFAGPVSFDLLDRAAIHSTVDQLARVRSTLAAQGADVAERLADAAACSSVLEIIDLWRQGRLLPDSDLATVAAPPWSIERDRALDRLDAVVAAQAAALHVLSASAFSLDVDFGPLLVAGQEAADAGLLSRSRKERAFVGLVAPLLVAEPPDAASLLNLLRHVAAARPQLAEAHRVVADLPGASLAGAWSPLDTGDLTLVRQVLTELPGQARAMASPAASTARSALAAGWVPDETFVEALRYAGDAWSWLFSALGAEEASIARWRNGDTFWKAWIRSESGWTTDGSRLLGLQRWTEIATAVEPLRDAGLGVLADGVLCGDLRASELFDRFRLGFIDVALEERLEAGRIDLFDGLAHDRRIEDFAARNHRRRLLTRDQIPADLVASRPMHRGKRIGRWGALEQELQRKSRKLSIRGLVEQYSDILPSLTPCFMMSPDSVSRFIPPGSIMFDLVVFDEASQIEVARAMGAIGRARALVVVGDTKQMPPTRFGGSGGPDAEAEADPEDENLYIDMESILSECVESNMPKRDLRCHYRSRHEALIAFSNQNFYDGRLTTFPSPLGSDHSPIGWRRVDGAFLRSGSGDSLRTNPVEAKAMVAEIIRRVSDPETTRQSIAVVTLNIQQQQLILNLLEASSNDRVKALVEDDGENGLIVRNLESVQGDERDVVMISVAFSPLITTDDAGVSQRGRMPLNFGPLNRLGGERRLNVAVTRAREEVVVFCSFEPEEMQLSEMSSLGVQLLRTYLLAARDGGRQSGDLVLRAPTAPDAHRSEVADALRARGLRVQENLGLSDFRIDLALSRPGDDGWKVAVLLDGPGWAAKKTVYDREVLPRSVLCGAMGWAKIERIWFPMWLNARDEVIDIIVAAVDATVAAPPPPVTASAAGDNAEGTETSEDVVIAVAQQEAARPPGLPFQSAATAQETMPADTSMRSDSKGAAGPGLVATLPVESETPSVGAVPHPSSVTLGEPLPYEVLGTREVLDRIAEPGPRQLVLQAIQEVIRRDAPVPPAFVAYTVALQFGLERVRQNRLDAIIDVIPANLRIEGEFGEFVWRPDQDPASYDEYRTELSNGAPPGVDIVPPEELVNAMFEIVTNGVAISVEELATLTAAEFGLKRVPAAARNYLNEVIAWAVEVGWLAAVDGAIRVPAS